MPTFCCLFGWQDFRKLGIRLLLLKFSTRIFSNCVQNLQLVCSRSSWTYVGHAMRAWMTLLMVPGTSLVPYVLWEYWDTCCYVEVEDMDFSPEESIHKRDVILYHCIERQVHVNSEIIRSHWSPALSLPFYDQLHSLPFHLFPTPSKSSTPISKKFHLKKTIQNQHGRRELYRMQIYDSKNVGRTRFILKMRWRNEQVSVFLEV